MTTTIQTKRVYADPDGDSSADGLRIYVDRLWPRGESKEKFHYDIWDKQIAPSDDLRHWFHQDPENRWDEFKERYIKELNANPATKELINKIKQEKLVTLLYSSHDTEHNNAIILADYLRGKI